MKIINSRLTRLSPLLLVFFLLSCGGGSGTDSSDNQAGQEQTQNVDQNQKSTVYFARTKNPEIPVIFASDSGEIMAALVNPSTGDLTGLDWVGPDGKNSHIQIDGDLPVRMDIDGYVFQFGNIREAEGLADLIVVTPGGDIIRTPDLPFNVTAIKAASALPKGISAASKPLYSAKENINWLAKRAAALANAAQCATAAAAASPTMAGVPIILLGCTGYMATLVSAIAVEDEEKVRSAAAGAGAASTLKSGLKCLAEKTAAIAECIDVVATAFAVMTNDAKKDYEAEIIDTAVNLLRGAGGDLQFLLVWDTTADLDLRVIDPDKEEISRERRSSSSGGIMDQVASNGWGPDNISWPVSHAITGLYNVYVDYPAGDAPANFIFTALENGRSVYQRRGKINPGENNWLIYSRYYRASGRPPVILGSTFDEPSPWFGDRWGIGPMAPGYSSGDFRTVDVAEYKKTGGLPGGYLTWQGNQRGWWFFTTYSDKYAGDRSFAYGKNLLFMLRTTYDGRTPDDVGSLPFVVLSGKSEDGSPMHIFQYQFDHPLPGPAWRPYTMPLTEAYGWHVSTTSTLSSPVNASGKDILQVLSTLTSIRIRGEYGGYRNRGDLDNVLLGI